MKTELPSKSLVIVANSATARFFGFLRNENRLVEFASMTNDEARLREGELISDSPGRTFDSFGEGRHRMEQGKAKSQVAERFAADVAQKIDGYCANENVYRVAIVAAPRFLGRLRACLSARSRSLLVAEIDKDMTSVTDDEILVAVGEYLLAPLADQATPHW